ncbi:AbrB/MazE/SpoVT family DNA-binding domain-containing protein [Alicyclobacillus sp. ALC3]|uniref:AbrB/MazE/SpoVT family DNA-binding domain-containing protein n=1 Tax=Alicyclobacillus sp. ALC3 TaxID=2796143 RepID=UPI0023797BE0|nr:AbrB/MazE/SpoVT family DNA-binding domain-containing protein [Alicyclobacillus sp. ALC3]WDL99750.1 AbrB/MazE/SpoVT family DNA-binding domain-containing protein [Alicyclobacillus sp. ALC3]
MTAISTLSSKGQTVIPVEIRRLLGAEQGDQIVFKVIEGQVIVEAVKRQALTSLIGILPATRDYVDDMHELRLHVYADQSGSKFKSLEDEG